jgi:hypothetical protein
MGCHRRSRHRDRPLWVLDHHDVRAIRIGKTEEALAEFGFVRSIDELPSRFELKDDDRRVDFHTVIFDGSTRMSGETPNRASTKVKVRRGGHHRDALQGNGIESLGRPPLPGLPILRRFFSPLHCGEPL